MMMTIIITIIIYYELFVTLTQDEAVTVTALDMKDCPSFKLTSTSIVLGKKTKE